MPPLNKLWQALFGQEISDFEEVLIDRGTKVMKPGEPLFIVYMMMVRVLHQSQGEMEKALLQFAPQMTSRARDLVEAVKTVNQELSDLKTRCDQINVLLNTLDERVGWLNDFRQEKLLRVLSWGVRSAGAIAFVALVFSFCVGFVIASYVSGR